jgi:hypothetical protein
MSRAAWKALLEAAGVDPNYTLPKRKKSAPDRSRTRFREEEQNGTSKDHIDRAVEEFLAEYRERIPQEDAPEATARKPRHKAPFKVKHRSITINKVTFGHRIQVPQSMEYDDFEKDNEDNLVVSVIEPPMRKDDIVILRTTNGEYIVPRKQGRVVSVVVEKVK